MKSWFLVAAAAVSFWSVPQAPAEVSEGDAAGGVMQTGLRILGSQLEKRREKAPQREDASAPAPESAVSEELSSSESAGQKFKNLAVDAFKGAGGASINEWLPRLLREMADKVVNEFKEQYKQEGREYAKELGTLVTERVLASEKIRSTLTTVKVLCWSVVAYLSVITIVIFFWLWRVKSRTERLFQLCEQLLKEREAEKKA
ncbi:MAG: hypothetical protein ACI4OX_02800 [Akkermansia sp.]